MYKLTRFLLALTIILAIYCIAAAAALTRPYSLCLVAFVVFVRLRSKRRQSLTAYGTARWADRDDLARHGMLNAKEGLILGRFTAESKARLMPAVQAVLSPAVRAKDACRRFIEAIRSKRPTAKGALVRLPNAVHTAVFAPTGVGKTVSCVAPFLLSLNGEDSCCVIDPKGELAVIAAEHLRRRGYEVVILDPYKLVTS
jgi:type IV secretion system protein VirD4